MVVKLGLSPFAIVVRVVRATLVVVYNRGKLDMAVGVSCSNLDYNRISFSLPLVKGKNFCCE